MLGLMSKESLKKTLKTKKVWFYSRSKKRLWMKGEISRNVLHIKEIKSDCDNDVLLIQAIPAGPTCHTGKKSCFNTNIGSFSELYEIILDRKDQMPKNSYTASLFKAGLRKINAKVKEEALEVIEASRKETEQRFIEESIDLLYHFFVLLAYKKIGFGQLWKEIKKRMKP